MVDIGYIIIPTGVDRASYVQTCFNTCKVSVIRDKGGSIYSQCFISPLIIQDIVFPKDENSTGSVVVMANSGFNETPIIVQVLKPLDELLGYSENTYTRSVQSKDGSVNLKMGDKGDLYINVDSVKSGKIYVNVLGDSETILDIRSNGSVKVSANENITLESFKNAKIRCNDVNSGEESFIEFNPSQIKSNVPDKFIVNEGSSAVALANESIEMMQKLKSQIDQIVTALNSSPTSVGDGGAAFKAGVVALLPEVGDLNFDSIKSKKLFAD